MKVKYVLELYVNPGSSMSTLARENLESVLKLLPEESYQLTIIDYAQHPELCEKRKLISVPALIKVEPEPMERFSGSFKEKRGIALTLGVLDKLPPSSEETPEVETRYIIRSSREEERSSAPTARDATMGASSSGQLLRDVIIRRSRR